MTAAPRAGLVARILGAQEAGLVIVIAVLMAFLTTIGGSKQQSYKVVVPPGATISQPSDATLVVTIDGRDTTHVSTSSWRIRDSSAGGGKDAFGQRTVNRFFESENLLNITTTASFIAVMAVGMTAIITLAGIDLSIGSIYAIAAIFGAMVLKKLDPGAGWFVTALVAIGVCCTTGAIAGGLNGAMSVFLRVHPFIITLGTMAIYRGLAFVTTGGQTISGVPDSVQLDFFKAELPAQSGLFPVPTLIMLAVALAGMFVLSRTVFGRRIYAIGGNETAAHYAGIPVGRVKIMVYAITGALAGLSGAMYMGYFAAAENSAGSGYELQVIAASVIGGASLSGGRGSAIGAVLGAILVQLISNTMIILEIDQSWNQIVMGAAIIIAVVIDQAKSRWSK
jgi:ribose/xylose/arabinose/galactoside ABC-type transport system permease subunit